MNKPTDSGNSPALHGEHRNRTAEAAEKRLLTDDLRALVKWFEANLCNGGVVDPRNHKVMFGLQHFAYLIKLRNKASGGKVTKPKRRAEDIRDGILTILDFKSIDEDRAQTLSWLRAIVERPTVITHNRAQFVPGDEVYHKEFLNKKANGYRYKALVCRRVGKKTLEPITSYRKKRLNVKPEDVIWPEGFVHQKE